MTDVKAELLPHEFTGPIVNGQHVCKWCNGTPNECSYVFGPYCDKRPQPSPKVDGLWQPIETVPDMRTVILWADTSDGETRNWKMASGYFNAAADTFSWEGRAVAPWDHKPTLWHPMPAPPVQP